MDFEIWLLWLTVETRWQCSNRSKGYETELVLTNGKAVWLLWTKWRTNVSLLFVFLPEVAHAHLQSKQQTTTVITELFPATLGSSLQGSSRNTFYQRILHWTKAKSETMLDLKVSCINWLWSLSFVLCGWWLNLATIKSNVPEAEQHPYCPVS